MHEGKLSNGMKVCCDDIVAVHAFTAQQVAVKMMKDGAMSEADFIAEGKAMQFADYQDQVS